MSNDSRSSDSEDTFETEGLEIESINDESQAASSEEGQPEDLKKELNQAKNDYLYLRAEFDNYRKNAIKERSDLLKFGPERMAREILDIVDTFELALSSEVNADNIEGFAKGMELTASNLKTMLGKFGIREVDPLGENFDPSIHEALSSEPTNEYEPGKICRVFKKAYKMHDRLLRPAQVVVAVEGSPKDTDKSDEN